MVSSRTSRRSSRRCIRSTSLATEFGSSATPTKERDKRRLKLCSSSSTSWAVCLSCRMLVGDESTGRAVVVDPHRDVSVYLQDASERGLRIERVIETHATSQRRNSFGGSRPGADWSRQRWVSTSLPAGFWQVYTASIGQNSEFDPGRGTRRNTVSRGDRRRGGGGRWRRGQRCDRRGPRRRHRHQERREQRQPLHPRGRVGDRRDRCHRFGRVADPVGRRGNRHCRAPPQTAVGGAGKADARRRPKRAKAHPRERTPAAERTSGRKATKSTASSARKSASRNRRAAANR